MDSRSGEAFSQGMGVAGADTTEFESSSFCRLRQTPDEGKQLLQVMAILYVDFSMRDWLLTEDAENQKRFL